MYYITFMIKWHLHERGEWIKHIDIGPSLTGVPRSVVCRMPVVWSTIVILFVARSVHKVLLTTAAGIPVSGYLPWRRLPLGIVHWLPWHLVLWRCVGGHATVMNISPGRRLVAAGRCLVTAFPRLLFLTFMRVVVRPMLIVVSLSPWPGPRRVGTRLCVAVCDAVFAVDRTHRHGNINTSSRQH